MRYLLPLLALLAGCSIAPVEFDGLTPAECRKFGVQVEDGAIPTGTVVKSEFRTLGGVQKECGDHAGYSIIHGCAKAAGKPYIAFPATDGKYAIYYAETCCVPFHEACHALYETSNHSPDYIIRVAQGQYLAACG